MTGADGRARGSLGGYQAGAFGWEAGGLGVGG